MKFWWLLILCFLNSSSIFALVYDVEAVRFTKPDIARADTGIFSDAKYYMVGKTGKIGVLLRNNGTLNSTQNKIELKVYIEDSLGNFNKMVFDTSYHVDIASGDSIEVSIPIYEWPNSFIPKVYDELGKDFPANKIPLHFSTMLRNVTPRYKIVATVQADQDTTNNTLSEVFRFYIQRSPIVLSVENSFADIENTSNPDLIAGKLNSDSLQSGLNKLGFYTDLFDSKGWEPNAADYTIYDLLFWSDGHDKPLTEHEKSNINRFLEAGKTDDKKNFVVCSQEMLRENFESDSNWVKKNIFIRKYEFYPYNPNEGKEYSSDFESNMFIIGNLIARSQKFELRRTKMYPVDPPPLPGLISFLKEGEGLTRSAFDFNKARVICPEPKEISAGAATLTLTKIIAYFAVDWRHFGDCEMLLKGIIDFINKNDSHTLEDPPKPKYGNISISPSEVYKFTGDTVSYKIQFSFLDNIIFDEYLVAREDSLNKKTDTVSYKFDKLFEYQFVIPEDSKQGKYQIKLKPITVRPMIIGAGHMFNEMEITILPDSAVISGSNNACQYDSVFYKLTGPNRTNSWSVIGSGEILTDNTGTEIKVYWKEPGENTVILQQTNQKTGEVKEYKYNVTVKPAPDKPIITQKGDTLFSSAETGNFWQRDGITISGGVGNYLVPKKSGLYTVRVTGENGCNSEMSDAIDFVLGVKDESTISDFSIIPNPANNYTVITYDLKAPGFVILKIYNTIGEEINVLVNEYQEAGRYSIPLTQELLPGAYYIKFQCREKNHTGKFLIIK